MNLSNFLNVLSNLKLLEESRKSVFRDEIENNGSKIIINTCCANTRKLETEICISKKWYIVEIYKIKNEAKRGHEKWLHAIKKGNIMIRELEAFNKKKGGYNE